MQQQRRDWSRLHLAAYDGNLTNIYDLVSGGTPVDQETPFTEHDKESLTPLHIAARYGQLASMEALLKLGADPTKYTHEEYTKRWIEGNEESIDGFSRKNTLQILYSNERKNTERFLIDSLTLLSNHPDVEIAAPQGGNNISPITPFLISGSIELLTLLLKEGASTERMTLIPGTTSTYGTPLFILFFDDGVMNPKKIELFRSFGADVNAKNSKGLSIQETYNSQLGKIRDEKSRSDFVKRYQKQASAILSPVVLDEHSSLRLNDVIALKDQCIEEGTRQFKELEYVKNDRDTCYTSREAYSVNLSECQAGLNKARGEILYYVEKLDELNETIKSMELRDREIPDWNMLKQINSSLREQVSMLQVSIDQGIQDKIGYKQRISELEKEILIYKHFRNRTAGRGTPRTEPSSQSNSGRGTPRTGPSSPRREPSSEQQSRRRTQSPPREEAPRNLDNRHYVCDIPYERTSRETKDIRKSCKEVYITPEDVKRMPSDHPNIPVPMKSVCWNTCSYDKSRGETPRTRLMYGQRRTRADDPT